MEQNDLTNISIRFVLLSSNRYRFNLHFKKWDFYCSNISSRNGSNVGTNCSIASEIVFYVPHNDLSSFSISGAKAVERNQFWVPFFAFAFPFALKKFSPKSTDTTQHNTQHKEKKSPFSVINSIFNLVCILSYLLPKASKKKYRKQTAFLHTPRTCI